MTHEAKSSLNAQAPAQEAIPKRVQDHDDILHGLWNEVLNLRDRCRCLEEGTAQARVMAKSAQATALRSAQRLNKLEPQARQMSLFMDVVEQAAGEGGAEPVPAAPRHAGPKPKRDRHGMYGIPGGLTALAGIMALVVRSQRHTAAALALLGAAGVAAGGTVMAVAPVHDPDPAVTAAPAHPRLSAHHRHHVSPFRREPPPPLRAPGRRRRRDADRMADYAPYPAPSGPVPTPGATVPAPSPTPTIPAPSPTGTGTPAPSPSASGPAGETVQPHPGLQPVARRQPGVRLAGPLGGQLPRVHLDHVRRLPAGDLHQVVLGAPGLEPVVGEGAPEPVRVHPGHTSDSGPPGEHLPDSPASELPLRAEPQPSAFGVRVAGPATQVPVGGGYGLAA